MAKNEDGEVELVLGSKVLMGVFFLGAVLLGLSFLMGYVVGKGAAPVLSAQQAPHEKTEPVAAITSPPVVEVSQEKIEPAPIKTAPQSPAEVAPKEVETAKVDTQNADAERAAKERADKDRLDKARAEKVKADKAIADKARADVAKLEHDQKAKADAKAADKAKADKQAKADKAKADKAAAEHAKADKGKAKAEPVKTAQAAATTAMPAKGRTYLQLSATGKDEAESLSNLLRSRGFASTTAQVPEKPTLFRVLVGPITPTDAAKTRADLKAKSFAGADNAIIKAF